MKTSIERRTPPTKKGRSKGVRCGRLVSRAYAWKIKDHKGQWRLCCFAEAERDMLTLRGKPTLEAVMVRVKLTPG